VDHPPEGFGGGWFGGAQGPQDEQPAGPTPRPPAPPNGRRANGTGVNGTPVRRPVNGRPTRVNGTPPTTNGRPVNGNPVSGNPVSGNPTRTNGRPVNGNPVRGNPVNGAPTRTNGRPVNGNPVNGNPVRGNPVRGNPVRGNPVRGNPVNGSTTSGHRPPIEWPTGPPSMRTPPVQPPRQGPPSVRTPPVPQGPPSVRTPPVRQGPPSVRRPPVPRPPRPAEGLTELIPPVVDKPAARAPADPPLTFDQKMFAEALTDPGPFGRVPFDARPEDSAPTKFTLRSADDLYDDLYNDEDNGEEEENPLVERFAEQPGRKRRKLPFWIELPVLVVVALVFTFLIQTFVARVYVIPSGSMELTLNGNNGSGDRIVVDKVVYDFHSPRPGDVVVFKGPPGWDQNEFFVDNTGNPVIKWLRQLAASIGLAKPNEYDLVKRVIAVGGQTIKCCDTHNRMVVDGKPLDEPYVYWQPHRPGPAQQLRFGPVTVPKGDLWVMGDNRSNSDDSRYQNGGGIRGVVPVANVIGKARTIIWPPSRWQGIGDHDPQTSVVAAAAPTWTGGPVPTTGIGVLAVLPTLWFGRRWRPKLRAATGLSKQTGPTGRRWQRKRD
jgi:signal peptidase I